MSGLAILSVGAGDIRLTFDRDNPAECIRSARMLTDMIRRGYAILVEIERNGEKAYERVREFREDICSYIIADFDPVIAAAADKAEDTSHEETEEASTQPALKAGAPRGKRGTRAIHASEAPAVAVHRSAGG